MVPTPEHIIHSQYQHYWHGHKKIRKQFQNERNKRQRIVWALYRSRVAQYGTLGAIFSIQKSNVKTSMSLWNANQIFVRSGTHMATGPHRTSPYCATLESYDFSPKSELSQSATHRSHVNHEMKCSTNEHSLPNQFSTISSILFCFEIIFLWFDMTITRVPTT